MQTFDPESNEASRRDESGTGRELVERARSTGQEVAARLGLANPPPHPRIASPRAVATASVIRAVEAPRDLAETIVPLERAFAFVDLCGFTKFIATNGEHAAIETIVSFRSLVREMAARRGVRVAKWLGGGR